MKNPFKKSSIADTVVNVGIGGAANVAIDYAVSQIPQAAKADPMYINAGKIALGAIAGSMIGGKYAKYLRAAADGVATVGASTLISSFIAEETPKAPEGLPGGTVGRVIPGNRRYMRRSAKVSGIGAAANAFMGA